MSEESKKKDKTKINGRKKEKREGKERDEE